MTIFKELIIAFLICIYGYNLYSQSFVVDTITVDIMYIRVYKKKGFNESDRYVPSYRYMEYYILNKNDWDASYIKSASTLKDLAHKKHDIYIFKSTSNNYINDHYSILKHVYKEQEMKFDYDVLEFSNTLYNKLTYSLYKSKKQVFEIIPMTVRCIRSFIPKNNPYYRKLINDGYQFVMDKVAVHSIIEVRQGNMVITCDMLDD